MKRMFAVVIGFLISTGFAFASPADFDGNGVVDFKDYLVLVWAFESDDAHCDLNGDGVVDAKDVRVFVQDFEKRTVRSSKFAKAGFSNLKLRAFNSLNERALVELGDVLNIDLFIEGNGEQMTGAVVHVDFDDRYLELIPAEASPSGIVRPFRQGPWMQGTVFQNGTLGEGGTGNTIPFFNMVYHEDIPTSFGAEQRAAVGDGVLATFQVRMIQRPPGDSTRVQVVRVSPFGSESGYFRKGDPGNVYSFRNIQDLTIQTIDQVPGRVVIQALLLQGQAPVANAAVALGRSFAGRAPEYRWSGTTDADGQVRIAISSSVKSDASGYYQIQATDANGTVVGTWHSVPIHNDVTNDFVLPIGERIRRN